MARQHTVTLCGQNAGFLSGTLAGKYSNHCDLGHLDGAHSTNAKEAINQNMKERDHMQDLGANGRITSKLFINKDLTV